MKNITQAVDIINSSVQPFIGLRSYLSTGNLNISKIEDLDLVSYDDRPSRANLEVMKGDVILARMQGTLKVKMIEENEENIIVSTGFIVLRPKIDVNSKYINHILMSEKFQREKDKLCSGATQKAINNRNFKKIQIPLPPLKTQEHIASILDDAAALRDKTAQLLEEYDLLAQSIFLEMFGDPVVNPKNWKKQPLSDLGTTTTGNTPSRRNKEYYGDYIEWIKTNNINTPNMYLTQAEEYLSEKGLEKGRMVKPGAILVTCIAGSRQVIGNVSIANRKVSFNQQINAFEPKNGCSFFWYYQFILAQHYVQNHSTDGMKGIITKGKFEKINFINPPVELQNEFAEKIALIEQQKDLARQELKESEDLFNCLLQKAFKGELVPESQEA